MSTTQTDVPVAPVNEPVERRPLRLWPGVIAVTLQWLFGFVLPEFVPDAKMFGLMGGFLGGGLLVALWWLFFSRARWFERIGVIALAVGAAFGTRQLVDKSIATAGMGMLLYIFAFPLVSLGLVCGAAVSRSFSSGLRSALIAAAILLAFGSFTLVRTGGISGDGDVDLHWRWTPTPEQRLLSLVADEPYVTAVSPTAAKSEADWPGFRGARRDGIARGVQIVTDWARIPPVELWRRPVGPGWSSFAVHGDRFYTQEQRGDEEAVTCYSVTTGQPIWMHHDAVRFWEANAGAGPRATPTLHNGRVYTLGATGIVNVLDAADGKVVWSHDAEKDTGVKAPNWGIASSPLVVDDVVIVATAGRLVAYDRVSGERRWLGPEGGYGYSSPHLAKIDDVQQVLLLCGIGAISLEPATGKQLWQYASEDAFIVQPAVTAEGDVLIGSGSGTGGNAAGVRRITATHGKAEWTTEERWSSTGIKPYFNDFVVHKDHAYGFDGSLLACIDLADGKRNWKGGRYGHGQLILLADQDLLLVLSEKGEVALVAAKPDQYRELARFPAIEGKTWNHPVLAGDILLVRNDQWMAAFHLTPAERGQ
jgi:outer membrane protein assembly factor BamB